MKKFVWVFIISFLTLFVIFQNNVEAGHLNYTLRQNSCNSGETCVFSIYNVSNAHASADCNFYTWKVCSTDTTTVNQRNFICNSNEGGIISLYNTSNAHAETYNFGIYNYSICVTPRVTCSYGSSAGAFEVPVVALVNQTNSHVGESAVYTNKIFCRDTAAPVITVNSPANASYTGLSVNANITLDDDGHTGMYSLDGAANITMTKDSTRAFSATITSTKGSHSVVFYANDTSGNMGVSSTVFFTLGASIIRVTGSLRESVTGKSVEGNVTVFVKEAGENTTNYTIGGAFIVDVASQIRNFQRDLITLGISANTTDQRIGYAFIEINAGGNVITSPNCVTKLWHFNGTIIDPTTGGIITAGNVSVNVKNSAENIFSNTTGFSSSAGIWDIYLRPCFVPGELVNFEFTIKNDTRIGYFLVRQVAK